MDKVIEIDFHIKYNMANTPTVADVIDSLSALQHLIPKSVTVLDKLHPTLSISMDEILVTDVVVGSLFEKVKVKLLVGLVGSENTAKLDEIMNDSIKKHNGLGKLLYASMGVVVGVGAMTAVKSCAPAEQAVVNNYYDNSANTVLLAENTNMTGEQVVEVVRSVMDKKTVQKTAQLIRPAKSDAHATIDINDEYIPSEVISVIPERVELTQPEHQEQDYTNIDVYISASDQDKSTQGWAGIVPDLFEKRVRFELSGNVEPFKLHGQRRVKADITVVKKYNKPRRQYVVDKVIIHRIAQ